MKLNAWKYLSKSTIIRAMCMCVDEKTLQTVINCALRVEEEQLYHKAMLSREEALKNMNEGIINQYFIANRKCGRYERRAIEVKEIRERGL